MSGSHFHWLRVKTSYLRLKELFLHFLIFCTFFRNWYVKSCYKEFEQSSPLLRHRPWTESPGCVHHPIWWSVCSLPFLLPGNWLDSCSDLCVWCRLLRKDLLVRKYQHKGCCFLLANKRINNTLLVKRCSRQNWFFQNTVKHWIDTSLETWVYTIGIFIWQESGFSMSLSH